MLAADFIRALSADGFKGASCALVLTDRAVGATAGQPVLSLDIANQTAVEETIDRIRPTWIINCAAYTAVDDAETNVEPALLANAIGPMHLARSAKRVGARMLHISSDYVFGNAPARPHPFTEADQLMPCGVYGHSKRLGDEYVLEVLGDDALLVRSSWLHGMHGPSFPKAILSAARSKPELRVVDDQIGSPTWTPWLVEMCLELMERDAIRVYNVASQGPVSWFEFAKFLLESAGIQTPVHPQSSAELGRPAPRPVFSQLDVSKLETLLGQKVISWKESAQRHLDALKQGSES